MKVFADLHIHIGRSKNNKPIKITGARNLNFENIAIEAAEKKGIDMVGIIDCMSPYVISDIISFLEKEEAYELPNGGIIYKDKVCIILGAEIETSEINDDGKTGSAHNVCYFPHLKDIIGFSKEMEKYIKNITLSTQRARLSGYELLDIVKKHNGYLIPAHVFTPFKSYYGNCTNRLKNIFKEKYDEIFAIELGLSADTYLADYISELENKTFLTNSDAHSLAKIAREYNIIEIEEFSFKGLFEAIKKGKVISNYGLDPNLGKYNRTYCDGCNSLSERKDGVCVKCQSKKIVYGVYDRILDIKDKKESISPKTRPKYIYQIPLEFIPGIGKKTIEKLIKEYGTEMNILHNITIDTIEGEFGSKIANGIKNVREGNIQIDSGGGGRYGRVKK